jgi:hypothetical protein
MHNPPERSLRKTLGGLVTFAPERLGGAIIFAYDGSPAPGEAS